MSKIVNSFFEGISSIFGLLIWGAIVYGLFAVAWNPDWNLNDLIGNSEKKEAWITAERGDASYSTVLDREWASSTFSHIEAKIKLRDTVVQSDKSDSLDLAYEVKARLTHPVLSSKNAGKEADWVFLTKTAN
jgi:hypothetical protein